MTDSRERRKSKETIKSKVMEMLREGKSNGEIARTLNISKSKLARHQDELNFIKEIEEAWKDNDTEKIKKIADNYPENVYIQRVRLRLAINENDEGIINVISDNFQDDEQIQLLISKYQKKQGPKMLLRIKNAIGIDDEETVRKIGEKYLDNPEIQLQYLKYAINKSDENKEYDSVIMRIQNNFPNYEPIQLAIIDRVIAISIDNDGKITDQNKLEEAEKIGYRENFKKCAPTQIRMIKIAILKAMSGNLRALNKAIEIGDKKIFQNNETVQSQMIQIEIIKGRNGKDIDWNKVERIEKQFQNNDIIQSQIMQVAIIGAKKGDRSYLEKAKRIGDKKIFKENRSIQSRRIQIAILEEDYAKAKEIGRQFQKSVHIQLQIIEVLELEGDMRGIEDIAVRFKFNNEIVGRTKKAISYIDRNKRKENEKAPAKRIPNKRTVPNDKFRRRMRVLPENKKAKGKTHNVAANSTNKQSKAQKKPTGR